MSDPTIIAAAIAGAVSFLALVDGRLHRRQLARERAEEDARAAEGERVEEEAAVLVARIGDDASIRAQLHEWLEQERTGHQECLAEVAQVRQEFIAFRAEHPNCAERIAALSGRVASLEAELGHAAE